MSPLETRILGVLVGMVMLAGGSVLVLDFRDIGTSQARKSVQMTNPLRSVRRIPPWKWLPEISTNERVRNQVRIGRVLGAVFAMAGFITLIASIFGSSSLSASLHLPKVVTVSDTAVHLNRSGVKEWLAKHPRFHVHFTPTGSSWINQVERWFGRDAQ